MARPKPTRPAEDLPPLGNAHRLLSFVYTPRFRRAWDALGLSDADRESVERQVIERPEIGAVMQGTGGLRKFRFAPARGGKGKSGSERVCYALFPTPGLVLMVAVFGKNQADNLTRDERNAVRALLAEYQRQLEEEGIR